MPRLRPIPVTDENGNVQRDENGQPIFESVVRVWTSWEMDPKDHGDLDRLLKRSGASLRDFLSEQLQEAVMGRIVAFRNDPSYNESDTPSEPKTRRTKEVDPAAEEARIERERLAAERKEKAEANKIAKAKKRAEKDEAAKAKALADLEEDRNRREEAARKLQEKIAERVQKEEDARMRAVNSKANVEANKTPSDLPPANSLPSGPPPNAPATGKKVA